VDDAAGRYIEFCKSTFPNALDLRGVKIVVDCAHGAGYHVAPPVFHELGADVVAIGDEPNGFNINDAAGATHPAALAAAVTRHGADVGIALDGDGDRLLMADAAGATYDGDQLLYVIAARRAQDGRLKGVVGTLMTNLAFERALGVLGVGFARAKVGDRYVLELMQERGWDLGGENSGHIICLDKHTTGDAIVSALQVLEAVRRDGRGLAELAGGLRLYPQKLINVHVARGFDWQGDPAITRARSEAESRLGPRGRLLLRASGTEPVIRVMVEGEDEAEVGTVAAQVAAEVERAAGALTASQR
jgi:phosphoglucosamine mutase